MDPQTVLEATRYTVLQARDPENLYRALHNKRGRTAGIVEDILQQLTVRDQLFADWISLARL
jgi:hypothetical protein